MIRWRYHRFRINPLHPIYCVAVKLNRTWNFIIDSHFLIHRIEVTKIAVLRFSKVTTAYHTVNFYVSEKFVYSEFDLKLSVEDLEV